ncbi:Protein SCO1, mitochondrial, partial [Saitozyma sp. JCM 24511]
PLRQGAIARRTVTSGARPAVRAIPLSLRRGLATAPSEGPSDQHQRDRAAVGPFTWKAAALFGVTGVGLYFYFESEKAKVQERKRQEHASKSIGRPSIGGPFALQTHRNEPFTEQDLLGNWTLIYFGFTNCPDICPEELDKMGAAVDLVDAHRKERVLPIFVSVDPARDSIEQVNKYVADFHPRMIGLTGDFDSVKRACKSYRVYFSTPPDAKATDDYLVDHSIFFYLMDPLGQFVDAFGKNTTAEEVAGKVKDAMTKWEKAGGNAAAGVRTV